MIFTRRAYERYRQFHMLGQPTATDEDAREILQRFGPAAIYTGAKTRLGDPIWRIEALGVELVAKSEDGTVVCVTVLPPPRFRGLTPLQAEAVEVSAQYAKARADEAQQKLAEHDAAARAVEAASRKVKETVPPRRTEVKRAAAIAFADRDVLLSTLKTMRHQMNREERVAKHLAALKIAVRALLDVGATEALAAISAIDPRFVREAFVNGGSTP